MKKGQGLAWVLVAAVGILAVAGLVRAADVGPAGPGPALRAGIQAYEAGDYERARALLETGTREGARQLTEAEVHYVPADPVVIAIRMEVVEGWKFLGFARAALGDEAKAADAFREALRLDPSLALDPRGTSPKILELFQTVQGGAAAPAAPGWRGPEHRPPLFCIKGNPVSLYVALGPGDRTEGLSLVYAIGSPAGEPFRLRAISEEDDRALWEIPAGATIGGRDLYYRFEEAGLGGRMRTGPWVPLGVLATLADLPDRLARLRAEYAGPAVDAVARTTVEIRGSPAGPLPPGVSSVDTSARALRSGGGAVSGLGSLLGGR